MLQMEDLASVVIPDRLGGTSQPPKGVEARWSRPTIKIVGDDDY